MSVFTMTTKRQVQTAVVVIDAGLAEKLTLEDFYICLGRLNYKMTVKSLRKINSIVSNPSKQVLSFEIQILKFTEEESSRFESEREEQVQIQAERIKSIHWHKKGEGVEVCCKLSEDPNEWVLFEDLHK